MQTSPSSISAPSAATSRERLRGHSLSPQPAPLFPTTQAAGANASVFNDFDTEDQEWPQSASRNPFSVSEGINFHGRPVSAWVVVGISSVLLVNGFLVLSVVCLSSYRSWVPSDALMEQVVGESSSVLSPGVLGTIDGSMWWLAVSGTIVGIAGILCVQSRSSRLMLGLTIVAGLLTLVELAMSLVVLFQSLSFSSGSDTPGSQRHLRTSLTTMWLSLAQVPSGAAAVCAIQHRFECSGLTTCCVANSTPVESSDKDDSHHFCFISYPQNGSMLNIAGVDISGTVEKECAYLSFDESCKAPGTLDTCLDHMEGALVAPYGFGVTAHCTWAGLLFALTYFSVALTKPPPRYAAGASHVAMSATAPGTRSAFDDDDDDPFAY